MKRAFAALALLALAACTPPQQSGAETPVRDLYAVAQENIGHTITSLDVIPMTDDLRNLVDRGHEAAAARGEPFIEGDMVLNCQDCETISGLEIGPQTGPEPVPAADGHVIVEARFTINGDQLRAVLYDMVETPQGWRIDNVLADGFSLRAEAQAFLQDEAAPLEVTPEP